jgi:hypothetical protein
MRNRARCNYFVNLLFADAKDEDQRVLYLKKAVGTLQLYLFLGDRCAQADLKDKPHA